MEGDFTRNSDDPRSQFSGVLMQQGRVQLDADWNEQWSIQTRALRTALADLIGAHGGPEGRAGFALLTTEDADGKTIEIGPGSYYVDGIRCETSGKPLLIDLGALSVDDGGYFAYLEVWDRHVSHVEMPALREVALLGVETASRAQTVWTIKLQALTKQQEAQLSKDAPPGDNPQAPAAQPKDVGPGELEQLANDLLTSLRTRPRPLLRAQARLEEKREPCAISPEARYRGPENQLYRVELHHAPPLQPVGNQNSTRESPVFRFKWSRENGSVVFPRELTVGPRDDDSTTSTSVKVKLGHLGRDARFGLVPGDVVEFVDRSVTVPSADLLGEGELDRGSSGVLGTVRSVEPDTREVTIDVHGGETVPVPDASLGPYLRRWDQRSRPASKPEDSHVRRDLLGGAVPVYASDLGEKWFELEHGVAVQFAAPTLPPAPGKPPAAAADKETAPTYVARGGDFWTIPARVVTGDVLWPKEKVAGGDQAVALPPHGVERHHAPLAFLRVDDDEITIDDLRKVFKPLTMAFK